MTQLMGTKIDLSSNKEYLVMAYKTLLSESLYQRAIARSEKSDASPQIDKYVNHIICWLDTTDFFTCPASTKYHDSEPSGLLRHSLNVYNQAMMLLKLPQFDGKVSMESATLVALTHDWCKIGRYETYYRNVKNPDTGTWESVPGYKTAQSKIGRLGHGVQSLTMLMQVCTHPLMSLSFEEMAAIRWHMGVYQVTDPERDDLFRCNDMVPLVLLTQFADQLSITDYAGNL